MSVTMSRFVRVMSGGTVVTDKLKTVRDGKVAALLEQMRAQLKRLTDVGVPCAAVAQEIQRVNNDRDAALRNPDTRTQTEALEAVKFDARARLGRISVLVGTHLGDQMLHANEVTSSLQAINAVSAAVGLLADPALQRQMGAQLADMQNRRLDLVNVADANDLVQATNDLDALATAARQLAVRAAQVDRAFGQRAGELAKVDTALQGLDNNNARVVDDPLKRRAATTRSNLRKDRDALATADATNLPEEVAAAAQLLVNIGTATTTSAGFVKFGETKPDRNLMTGAARQYIAEGKKAHLDALAADALKLNNAVFAALRKAANDPHGADTDVRNLLTADYRTLKDTYQQAILLPKLKPKLAQALIDNPTGPEKQMQDALGGPEFESRMLEVYNTAEALGSPEIGKLSIGEAVAVYTYTSNDYWVMNGVNLGYYTAKSPQEAQEIKIKNDEAKKALAKLDAVPIVTKRGEKRWPGDDAQYVAGQNFTLKAFWSTGVGFSFPGEWQIAITGKTGKDVASMSAFPKEAEVLFPPGTNFKVTRVDTSNPNKMLVEVEEV
jgi:hypothetical protein